MELLDREYIGFDINPEMIDYVSQSMQDSDFIKFKIFQCNAMDTQQVADNFKQVNHNAQFMIMHPPYMDIVKFTDNQEDLSQCNNIGAVLD